MERCAWLEAGKNPGLRQLDSRKGNFASTVLLWAVPDCLLLNQAATSTFELLRARQ